MCVLFQTITYHYVGFHNYYVSTWLFCTLCMYYVYFKNLMTVSIIYIIRNPHIICACVSGVILCPDYYVFHGLHYVMIIFALCKLNRLMCIMCIMHIMYCHAQCVLCTLFYVLRNHNAHNYIRCECFTYKWHDYTYFIHAVHNYIKNA